MTDAPAAAILVVSAVVVLSVWLVVVKRGADRLATRWLVFTIAWSGLALAVVAPSLQTVVAGLPNDHYHAYMDPIVFVVVGLGARALTVGSGPRQRVDSAARTVVGAALVGLVLLGLRLAPPQDPNGGWPAARESGTRIVSLAPGPFDIRQLPIFKTAEGVGFPVIVAGGEAVIATDPESALSPLENGATVMIACDRLFESVIGEPCGGPAETRYLERLGLEPGLLARFDQSPRISISIYAAPAP